MEYKVRVKCAYGAGVNDWHYEYFIQSTLDISVICASHSGSVISDFVILEKYETI